MIYIYTHTHIYIYIYMCVCVGGYVWKHKATNTGDICLLVFRYLCMSFRFFPSWDDQFRRSFWCVVLNKCRSQENWLVVFHIGNKNPNWLIISNNNPYIIETTHQKTAISRGSPCRPHLEPGHWNHQRATSTLDEPDFQNWRSRISSDR